MTVALFYENPRPLDAVRDARLRVRDMSDFSFTREINTIPINLVEFPLVARHYPIAFIGEACMPSAIVGLDKRNLFVDGQGRWRADAYIPAFVRRYPFIFGDTDTPDRLSLCIDDNPRAVAIDDGKPLFENGQPTSVTSYALEFCRAFQRNAVATDAFGRAIRESGLLVERKADAKLTAGPSFRLAGFKCIDPDKLRKVPARSLGLWNAQDWLAPIYTHLYSMNNWNQLLDMLPEAVSNRPN